jgi:hypothetical protein
VARSREALIAFYAPAATAPPEIFIIDLIDADDSATFAKT